MPTCSLRDDYQMLRVGMLNTARQKHNPVPNGHLVAFAGVTAELLSLPQEEVTGKTLAACVHDPLRKAAEMGHINQLDLVTYLQAAKAWLAPIIPDSGVFGEMAEALDLSVTHYGG